MRRVKLVLALLMVMAIGLPSFATTYFDEDMEAYSIDTLSGTVPTHNGGTFQISGGEGSEVKIVDVEGDQGQVLYINNPKTSSVYVKMAMETAQNDNLLFEYDIADVSSGGWGHTCMYIYDSNGIGSTANRAVYTRWQGSGNPHQFLNKAATTETLMEYNWASTPRWFHVEMMVPKQEGSGVGTYRVKVVDKTDGTVIVDDAYPLANITSDYSFLYWYQCVSDYGKFYLDNVKISSIASIPAVGVYFSEDMGSYDLGSLSGDVPTHNGGTFWINSDNPATASVEVQDVGGDQGQVLYIEDAKTVRLWMGMGMSMPRNQELLFQYDIADVSSSGWGHTCMYIYDGNGTGSTDNRPVYTRWQGAGNPHKFRNMAATTETMMEYNWTSTPRWFHVEMIVPEYDETDPASNYHMYVVDKTDGTVVVDGTYPLANITSDYSFLYWYQSATDYGKFYLDNVQISQSPTVTPTISPQGGYFSEAQGVTFACEDADATIRYTTNGLEPTEDSDEYTGDPVEISTDTTLLAKAWAPGHLESRVATADFIFPTSYDQPETIPYSNSTIDIDADLSDWADATWVELDETYDGGGAFDVTEAYYAAKWGDNGNKVYVAVKLKDNAYWFTDEYAGWSARDAVEIYIHTTSVDGYDYSGDVDTAQQYVIGIKDSDHSQVWTSLRGKADYVLPNDVFQAAGQIVEVAGEEWIYYEAVMTPYEYFGGFAGQPSVVSTLEAEDVIGLDVCVVGHGDEETGYTGMKSENLMRDKSTDWRQFGLHKLVGTSLIPGDANGDGSVDVGDLGILAANYGTTTGATWVTGDFNDDGAVDVGDLGILAANYGTNSSSANFDADYAKVFGEANTEAEEDADAESLCSAIGLPLIAGLLLVGLMLVKLEE